MSPNPTGRGKLFPVPVRWSPIPVVQHGKLSGNSLAELNDEPFKESDKYHDTTSYVAFSRLGYDLACLGTTNIRLTHLPPVPNSHYVRVSVFSGSNSFAIDLLTAEQTARR